MRCFDFLLSSKECQLLHAYVIGGRSHLYIIYFQWEQEASGLDAISDSTWVLRLSRCFTTLSVEIMAYRLLLTDVLLQN